MYKTKFSLSPINQLIFVVDTEHLSLPPDFYTELLLPELLVYYKNSIILHTKITTKWRRQYWAIYIYRPKINNTCFLVVSHFILNTCSYVTNILVSFPVVTQKWSVPITFLDPVLDDVTVTIRVGPIEGCGGIPCSHFSCVPRVDVEGVNRSVNSTVTCLGSSLSLPAVEINVEDRHRTLNKTEVLGRGHFFQQSF